MDRDHTSSVVRLDEQSDAASEEERRPAESKPQPQRLLGELSRASESLAEVLDSLTVEKRELESRAARLEKAVERLREGEATARKEALAQIRRAEEQMAAQGVAAARDVARHRARAERAERLLTLAGGERETAAFCVTVGRLARRRASRDLLKEAVSHGVDLRLSAHDGWFDSLLVAEAEGEPALVEQFLTWARGRFADDEFGERQA